MASWTFALLLLGVVVAVMVQYSELEEIKRLVKSLDGRWLLAAAALQAATYFCAAGVWDVALVRQRRHVGVFRLVRLALLMLFANQAIPTAGLSGGAAVVHALGRRRVPSSVAMGALLVGLMTTYIAYSLAIAVSALLLHIHAPSGRLVAIVVGFAAIAIGVPPGVVWYRRSLAPRLRRRLKRVQGIGSLLEAIERTPTRLLRDRVVLARAVALQLTELTLDAATLGVLLAAVGVRPSPAAVFGSYVIASAISRFIPVPMGLGSSEAALVLMLRAVEIPLEPAVTATLLLRAFTFWLPMLPGLSVARQEFSKPR